MQSKIDQFVGVYQEHGVAEAVQRGTRYVGAKATKKIMRPIYQPPSIFYHSRYASENSIFNENWDLLIVLDTCRVDALELVSDEYDFISDVGSRWSVGANSAEWILNTFSRQFKDEISETAYVTSNPHAVTVIEEQLERHYDGELRPVDKRLKYYNCCDPVLPSDFHTYVPLYDQSLEHPTVEYPDPRKVTDHAIKLGRTSSPDRMVLHYMPPHQPYIAHQDDGIRIDNVQSGTSFESYLNNLRWGLNEVELLLQNIDRQRVVITADHGENFRLRSIRAGHKPGMITPAVRRVPWAITTSEDKGNREPDVTQSKGSELESMLEALGYR